MTLHKAKDFKNFQVSRLLLNLRCSNYLYDCIQINVPGKSPLIYRNLQWLIFMQIIKHAQVLGSVKKYCVVSALEKQLCQHILESSHFFYIARFFSWIALELLPSLIIADIQWINNTLFHVNINGILLCIFKHRIKWLCHIELHQICTTVWVICKISMGHVVLCVIIVSLESITDACQCFCCCILLLPLSTVSTIGSHVSVVKWIKLSKQTSFFQIIKQ